MSSRVVEFPTLGLRRVAVLSSLSNELSFVGYLENLVSYASKKKKNEKGTVGSIRSLIGADPECFLC